MNLCHHIWIQSAKDEISTFEGLKTTKYTHKCPKCGKIKTTMRASRKLPPKIKWKRELEKLINSAKKDGYKYYYVTDGLETCVCLNNVDNVNIFAIDKYK